MCTVSNGVVTLCEWGKRSRARREVVPLLLTSNMRASEISASLGRRLDRTRTSSAQVRRIRAEAERHGCLPPRSKTCPDCPPEKPTPTPLGGRCPPCQEKHQALDQQRYCQRAAACIPARTDGLLPPLPRELPAFPLGTVWFAPRTPSKVELPVLEVRASPPARLPSFSRARCEVDAWSRPTNPMAGV